MTHEFPGHYARIEGPDGVGKTTQLELAKQFSQDHDINTLFVREPGGTELGEVLRHLLLKDERFDLSAETETLLLTADRNHLIETKLQPALESGQVVISDRGIESAMIYQPATGTITAKQIETISSLILPEWYMQAAVALLSLSKATQKKRLTKRFQLEKADKIESRDEAFATAVFEGYKNLEKASHVTTINSERTPEEVFDNVKPVLFGKFLPRDTHRTIL